MLEFELKVNGELLYLYYGGAGGDDTTILVAKTLTSARLSKRRLRFQRSPSSASAREIRTGSR